MRTEFITPAREDLLAASAYYASQAIGLGERFILDVERSLELILAFPLLGTPGPAETRRVFLHTFPYSLVYRVEGEVLRIYAVAADRRLPGFWRDRV